MRDLFSLNNIEIIDLYEIKISDFEGYLRFHGSKNFNRDLVYGGNSYLYIPSEISNLEYNSEGKQSRPTLTISNINNFITNFIKDRSDLLGKRFFRKKILAKDLDAENFYGSQKINPLGNASIANQVISVDTFVIQKKNIENKEKVEFVLANILDIDGLTAPTRKIFNDACQWQYRGCGCNYGKINGYDGPKVIIGKIGKDSKEFFSAADGNLGIPMADENNKLFLAGQDSSLSAFESYKLTTLTYKKDYNQTVTYNKGDFIKIDPDINYNFNEKVNFIPNELPSRFFVCLEDNTIGKHPFSYTAVWKEDKCSKNLNGCSIRFFGSDQIPFGGFPGTVSYDYKMPS
jgi:hypothetical protein